MGMVVPDYREGDNVSAGRQVAELLDSSAIEFVARVPETDRNTVAAGQKAMLTLDGLSAAQLGAKVTNVGIARPGMGFFRGPEGPVRLVDVSLTLDKPMTTARPGLTAKVRIASDPLKNVLYVPRQAIFDKDGTSLVYVKVGDRFEARAVTIAARTESAVVISGLTEGAEIALTNPDQKNIQNKSGSAKPINAGRRSSTRRDLIMTTALRRRPADAQARHRQPPDPQTPLAADHARHDLRRRRRRLHALHRRRRTAAGDGLHREPRRPQPDRRSPRSHRHAGAAEGAQGVARTHVQGPARHPGERQRPHRLHRAQAVHAVEDDPQAGRRHADRLRRRALLHADLRPPGPRRPLLQRRRRGQRGGRGGAGGRRPRHALQRTVGHRRIRQGQRAVAARRRRRRTAVERADGRRRRARRKIATTSSTCRWPPPSSAWRMR